MIFKVPKEFVGLVKKVKAPSVGTLIRKFHEFIRFRDSMEFGGEYFRCISCREIKPKSQMNAGHFIPGDKRFWATKFHPKNVHGQCIQCNLHMHGNLAEYRKSLVEKYGEVEVLKIEALKHTGRKPRDYERIEIMERIKSDMEALK